MQPHLCRHLRGHRNHYSRCPERKAHLSYIYLCWTGQVPLNFASVTHFKQTRAAQLVMKEGKGPRSRIHGKLGHPPYLVTEEVKVQGQHAWWQAGQAAYSITKKVKGSPKVTHGCMASWLMVRILMKMVKSDSRSCDPNVELSCTIVISSYQSVANDCSIPINCHIIWLLSFIMTTVMALLQHNFTAHKKEMCNVRHGCIMFHIDLFSCTHKTVTRNGFK